MNKKIIKISILFMIIMTLTLGNIIASQSDSLIITTIGLDKLTIPKNVKDNNLKFNVKLNGKDTSEDINVKVEYYTNSNYIIEEKTNEFIVKDSTIVELSNTNAIDTFNLKEGDYKVNITFTVGSYSKIIKIPLKVVPEFESIYLKVDDSFKKDYTHGKEQPVIIPVRAYGVDANNNEHLINDELLEIKADFSKTMSLSLWNNNGVYYLSLDCNKLDMEVGEYEIIFTAKQYESLDRNKVKYETTVTTNLSIIKSVSSISFKSNTMEIEKGKTQKLEIKISPQDALKGEIEWLSEDENIVTVDNGNITGVNIGSTIISAKLEGLVAEILVSVKPICFIEEINIKDVIDSLEDQNQGEVRFETNNNIVMNQEILEVLGKNRQKDVSVIYKNEGKVKYVWTFHGTYIMDKKITNIPLEINTSTDAPEQIKDDMIKKDVQDVMYLNFKNEGEIPCYVDISVYVGDKYKPGDKVLLYHYNVENKELELKSKRLVVNEDGMITFEIDHCSTYVVSSRALFKNNTIMYIVFSIAFIGVIFCVFYFIKKKKAKLNYYKS